MKRLTVRRMSELALFLSQTQGAERASDVIVPFIKPGSKMVFGPMRKRKRCWAAMWNAINGAAYKPHHWTEQP